MHARMHHAPETRSLVTKIRGSLWAPLLLRALGVGAGMLTLAWIGAIAWTAAPARGLFTTAASTLEVGGTSAAVAAVAEQLVARGEPSTTRDADSQAGLADSAPTVELDGDAGAPAPPLLNHDGPLAAASDPGALPPPEQPGERGGRSARATPEDPVHVNEASEADLRRLPGVGAKRAAAILALRARLGHFRRVEELMRVKGVGRSTIRKWRPLLRVAPRATLPTLTPSASETRETRETKGMPSS